MIQPEFNIKVYRTVDRRAPFKKWMDSIHDNKTRNIINMRITRMARGNFGVCRDLKDGVWELKIRYGPGFRVYFSRIEKAVLLLLLGGDKSSQFQDVRQAKEFLHDYKKQQDEKR